MDRTLEQSSGIPQTIAQFIYLNIKKLIIEGELKPNQRITQKEIEDRFHVSSSPVREAIHRLCADKLLERSTRKYVLVQSISYEEIKQLYEVIRVLETYGFVKFVSTITDEDLNVLKGLTEELSEYCRIDDVKNFIKTNFAIHDRIWKNCENKYLYETLQQFSEKVQLQLVRENYMPFRRKGALEKSLKEHLRILEAIEKKDLAALELMARSHWGQELSSE